MPSPTRAKTVCLITIRVGEIETPIGVVGTFRGAYKIALFEAGISYPNLPERAALSVMNKNGTVTIWDTKQFQYEEEAKWSPLGKMMILRNIPVRHT
jgi:hypothetical protein